jgi:hypothetical protein
MDDETFKLLKEVGETKTAEECGFKKWTPEIDKQRRKSKW